MIDITILAGVKARRSDGVLTSGIARVILRVPELAWVRLDPSDPDPLHNALPSAYYDIEFRDDNMNRRSRWVNGGAAVYDTLQNLARAADAAELLLRNGYPAEADSLRTHVAAAKAIRGWT